jgi:hypothetical protein
MLVHAHTSFAVMHRVGRVNMPEATRWAPRHVQLFGNDWRREYIRKDVDTEPGAKQSGERK